MVMRDLTFPLLHDQAIDNSSWLNKALSFESGSSKQDVGDLPTCVS